MGLKEDIQEKNEFLKKKRAALKKLVDQKHEQIEGLPSSGKAYHDTLGQIDDLTKDIEKEVRSLDSDIRKYRFIDFGDWWNGYIGGWLAALVVDIFDVLIDLIKRLLGTLNDPDELVKILDKLIGNVDKLVK